MCSYMCVTEEREREGEREREREKEREREREREGKRGNTHICTVCFFTEYNL